MAYAIKKRARAKPEIQTHYDTYGESFVQVAEAWFADIAARAENKDDGGSIDAIDVLTDVLRSKPGSVWRRWWSAPLAKKVKALAAVIRTRKAPWQFRYESRDIVCLGPVRVEIELFYEIDHVERRIVITKFIGPLSE